MLADALSKQINMPVVVLNKAGAGGAIGHREIVNAKPDGYTIGMFSSGGIALPYLNAQANTIDELQPLAFFGEDPNALAGHARQAASPILKEYVDKARANPGKIRNGNDQPGGAGFLAIAQYEKDSNIKVTKVSYTGYGPTVTALMSGEIDSATVAIPDTDRAAQRRQAAHYRRIGDAAALLAPEIPTFREQGFDVVVGAWRCLAGPKGMPADRLSFLETNLLDVLKDPDFQAKAKQAGFIVTPGDAKVTARSLEVGRQRTSIRFCSMPGSSRLTRNSDPDSPVRRAADQEFSRRPHVHGFRPARALAQCAARQRHAERHGARVFSARDFGPAGAARCAVFRRRTCLQDGEAVEGWAWKPLVLITLSSIAFALLLKPVGLVGTLAATTVLASAAGTLLRPLAMAMLVAIMVVANVGIFVFALNMPHPALAGDLLR